ncbi:glycine cleavage system aminomethyltransferase GcvT [uncultured Alistipes sp.]|uniref:glycine cleavage system aminomethyltransferase GcvT n=1 Tax=uncultured Alistipes sp. TaxID=538949 RepID=UPI0025D36EFB|nr:glycine cleavage system aminomethyltransferase GcvT [uncultured Alistipes sp.]
MKTTVFTEYHIANGARMAEFAGYNMPIEFTGINDEHLCVRERAGVFDVSHMGEIWVKGPRALDLLQRITSNDVSKLYDGKVQYSCMLNGRGGIVDDILVYRIDAETYLLVVNAANVEKDWRHICAQGEAFGMTPGKELYNASDEICQLAVQGPLAMKIVQKMCDEPVEEMEYYTFRKMKVAGCDAILSITGYTGAGGCEIYVANEDGERLWTALWQAGEEFGLQNIGLGARDTLRLEKGFCLYGNDIDDTTSPIEAGLGWITKFAEGKEFIDRGLMERQKAEGVSRKLVGFKLIDRGIPRHEYKLTTPAGEEIGCVTSGTMSPCLKIGVGMGYVRSDCAKAGTEIAVEVRGRLLKAEVVKLPFV